MFMCIQNSTYGVSPGFAMLCWLVARTVDGWVAGEMGGWGWPVRLAGFLSASSKILGGCGVS
jgi:hypothetical protein